MNKGLARFFYNYVSATRFTFSGYKKTAKSEDSFEKLSDAV